MFGYRFHGKFGGSNNMIILEPRLDEILNILQEEGVEVVQAVCKIRRFGFNSCHPATSQTNREHLAEELGDLQCMIELLIADGIVTQDELDYAKAMKIEKLKKWTNLYV